ncbi:SCP2 domain-containing protein [Psychromonas sp. MB-3u-54]|uniref:ubiquinone anaerobic biosynthesis accessory factor UbiT n=1 Tax=Psychromonas sp. MB-3u-54 TaxID=2058319 RepID=UPI000C334703|nr:SCP2 sterol-binding domain-containing protein [Psychromonas sp. MB-3u-54]PKH01021.1 SCP2 domain-containing protein [Psychromonas sp. MB-3u-54]
MFTSAIANVHHQLVINAPKALAYPNAFVPFFMQKKLLSELLDRLLSEAIEDNELNFLHHKWLKIEVTDLKFSCYLSFLDKKFMIKQQCEQSDVTFSGALNEFILIAGRKEDPDTLFFQRRLVIEGDTELGLEIKNLLDNIDFENLSPLVEKSLNNFADFVQRGLIKPQRKEISA